MFKDEFRNIYIHWIIFFCCFCSTLFCQMSQMLHTAPLGLTSEVRDPETRWEENVMKQTFLKRKRAWWISRFYWAVMKGAVWQTGDISKCAERDTSGLSVQIVVPDVTTLLLELEIDTGGAVDECIHTEQLNDQTAAATGVDLTSSTMPNHRVRTPFQGTKGLFSISSWCLQVEISSEKEIM